MPLRELGHIRTMTDLCRELAAGRVRPQSRPAPSQPDPRVATLLAQVEKTGQAVADLANKMSGHLAQLQRNIGDRPTQRAVAAQLQNIDKRLGAQIERQNAQLQEALVARLDPEELQGLLASHNAMREEVDDAFEKRMIVAQRNSASQIQASLEQKLAVVQDQRDKGIAALEEMVRSGDAAVNTKYRELLGELTNAVSQEVAVLRNTQAGASAELERKIAAVRNAPGRGNVNVTALEQRLLAAQAKAASNGDAARSAALASALQDLKAQARADLNTRFEAQARKQADADAALERRLSNAQGSALARAVAEANASLQQKLQAAKNVARSAGDAELNQKLRQLEASRNAAIAGVQAQVADLAARAPEAASVEARLEQKLMNRFSAMRAQNGPLAASGLSAITAQHNAKFKGLDDSLREVKTHLDLLDQVLRRLVPARTSSTLSLRSARSSDGSGLSGAASNMSSLPRLLSAASEGSTPSTPARDPSLTPAISLPPPAQVHDNLHESVQDAVAAAQAGATPDEVHDIVQNAVHDVVAVANLHNATPAVAPLVQNAIAGAVQNAGAGAEVHADVQMAANAVMEASLRPPAADAQGSAAEWRKYNFDHGEYTRLGRCYKRQSAKGGQWWPLQRLKDLPVDVGEDKRYKTKEDWAAQVRYLPQSENTQLPRGLTWHNARSDP